MSALLDHCVSWRTDANRKSSIGRSCEMNRIAALRHDRSAGSLTAGVLRLRGQKNAVAKPSAISTTAINITRRSSIMSPAGGEGAAL
jgi:hypothetical protein